MSGSSDYTLTPNYHLYKPNYDADVDNWGYHLNNNADTLDALLATSGGGAVFLPLSGALPMRGALTLLDGGTAISQTAADGRYLQQAQGDARYLQLTAGGTVAGATTFSSPLTLSDGGTAISQAAADGRYLQLTAGGTVAGPLTLSGGASFGANCNFTTGFTVGTALSGSTLLRLAAPSTVNATLQFFKGGTTTPSHRWDVLTSATANGETLQAVPYDDTGNGLSALFTAYRYSGISKQGGPYWNIAPWSVGAAAATSPNGSICNQVNNVIDTQPTTTLAANPIATTNGSANVTLTWVSACAAGGPIGTFNTTSETWVSIAGATAVGGITLAGWYAAHTIDNDHFYVQAASAASSTATGGGSAVTVTPSFGTHVMQTYSTCTTAATTFPLQTADLFVVNPAFYQPIGGKGPNYQQHWSQFITAPDTSGTHQFIHINWEMDLCNRGGNFGYSPILNVATNPTAGIWFVALGNVPSYAAGGGTGQAWDAGLVFTQNSAAGTPLTGFYEILNVQPRTLVSQANDPTGHGGVALDLYGSYVALQANPFGTTNGSGVVNVRPTQGSMVGLANGNNFTLQTAYAVNGLTIGPGSFPMSAVDQAASTFSITVAGSATASGFGGGSGVYGFFPALVPFAPAQFLGEWAHGIVSTQAQFDSGGIIETQPGNGFLWSDGTGIASVNSSSSSAGNLNVDLTPAGTGTIVAHGDLTLLRDPSAPLMAATRQYVDAGLAGKPSIASVPLVVTTTGQVSLTGSTTETNMAALRIPANTMGANGVIEVKCFWSYTNSSNNKTILHRLGATSGSGGVSVIGSVIVTTTASSQTMAIIRNNNAVNSQTVFASASTPFGPSGSAPLTSSQNSAADLYININGQLAVGTETLTLVHAYAVVFPHA